LPRPPDCSLRRASTHRDEAALAEARLTKPTVYAHFGSKEALVAEYLKQMDRAVRSAEMTLGDSGVAARERLLSIFDAMLLLQPRGVGDVSCSAAPFLSAAVEVPDPAHPPTRSPSR
jgi:AcrR family transcriptional regulator